MKFFHFPFLVLSICTSFGQVVVPIQKDQIYAFNVNNVYFEIDAQNGGRISSVKVDNEEILYVNKAGGQNWGSTFWTSPQAVWNWPPSNELDKNPYTGGISNNKVFLKSETVSGTSNNPKSIGYQFSKTFSAQNEDTCFTITYSIKNNNNTPVKAAPWEVTRYEAGGMTLFGQRTQNQLVTGPLAGQLTDQNGVSFFDYDSAKVPLKDSPSAKMFSDGTEGWLAHVRRNGNMIIKKFSDTPVGEKAPDPENEVELYTNPDKSYQEVEQQGAYTTIGPGDSLIWTVKWYVRKAPLTISLSPQSASLVSYVRSVGSSITGVDEYTPETLVQQLYPNPVTNQLFLRLTTGVSSIIISNAAGQVCRQINFIQDRQECTLDLAGLSQGFYFLKVISSAGVEIKSIVVER